MFNSLNQQVIPIPASSRFISDHLSEFREMYPENFYQKITNLQYIPVPQLQKLLDLYNQTKL